LFRRRTPEITGEHAISELIEVTIGNVKQWVCIRGKNRNHPILLMLHGGPGTSQIGFIRKFQTDLEQHFVIVQWDQRGAGLSYSKKIPPVSMHIDQFVQDTIEVTAYILHRLHRQQLYLIGHSWGTILGMLAIQSAPHLYKRYFGVAQLTHVASSDRLSYQKLLKKVKAENDGKAYKTLRQIGPPLWDNFKQDRIHRKYIESLGGGMTRDGKMVRKMLLNLITSKEYTWYDCIRYLQGQFFSKNHLQTEMEHINLMKVIPSVDIPIYFLMGKHDLITPYEPTEQFFNNIMAPEKQWIMFEHAAHTPILEEPEKFMDVLLSETGKDAVK
jgi:pimeloyl-ACP methyl ester carboxylesterase